MQDFVLISIPKVTISEIVEQAVKKAIAETQNTASPAANLPELLNRKEAANLAGVCVATLDNKVREGILKRYRTGGIVRFKRQEVIEAFSKSLLNKQPRRNFRPDRATIVGNDKGTKI